LFVVEGGDSADGEAVAFVSVGEGDGGFVDAWEAGDVGALFEGGVGFHFFEELFVGVDDAGDVHAWFVGLGDLVGVVGDFLDWDLFGWSGWAGFFTHGWFAPVVGLFMKLV